MMLKREAKELYQQKKDLKRKMDALELDKIGPFITDLYAILSPEWREILGSVSVFSRVFELGSVRIVLNIGPDCYFRTEEEALRRCSELRALLDRYIPVGIVRSSRLIELTFFLDPNAV